jgi:uncharacterized repeat protein (TIGR01451 family)
MAFGGAWRDFCTLRCAAQKRVFLFIRSRQKTGFREVCNQSLANSPHALTRLVTIRFMTNLTAQRACCLRRAACQHLGITVLVIWCWLLASVASAQTPLRYLVNPSFESPDFSVQCTGGGSGVPPVRGYLAAPNQPPGAVVNPAAIVPGWNTTSTDTFANGFMCTGVASTVYRPTQIFRNDLSSANAAADGVQYAELNPEVESRIYQQVCVSPGESFGYSWNHRARISTGGTQQARAVLCRNGAGFTQAVECGGVAADTYAVGPIITGVTSTWTLRTGSFTASVPSAVTAEFGFESVAPAGSAGNLIDNAQLYMRPLIDWRTPSPNTLTEAGINNALNLVVNGILYSPAIVVIRRTGAALPTVDYTLGAINRGSYLVNASSGDITLTLAAGTYNPNTTGTAADAGVLRIPMNVVNDGVIEATETVTYALSNADITGGGGTTPAGVVAGSLLHILNGVSATCSAPNSSVSYSVADNDNAVLTKGFVPSSTLQGQSTTLVFTLTNPAETTPATGRITSTLTMSFTDVLPAGIRTIGGVASLSAGCVGTAPSIAAASNTVVISGIRVVGSPPAGPGAAAVSCTVSVPVINSPTLSNTSCAGNPAAFTNAATNISASTNVGNSVTPSCLVVTPAANLSVSKTNALSTLTAGVTSTYTLTFANAGPANATNATIGDTPSAGLANCAVVPASCTATPGATCPASFAGFFSGGVTAPQFDAGSSITLLVRCGVTATGLP